MDPGEEGQRSHHAAREVDHREAGLGRRAVRFTGQAHPAGDPLEHIVVGRLVAPGSGHAKAAEADTDHPWIHRLQVLVTQAKLLGDVTAQVRIDSVGDPDQILQHRPPGGPGHVEAEAELVPVEGFEEKAVLALLEGRNVAADIAAGPGILDLDHLRAEVGQEKAAKGTGPVLLDGDDAHILKGEHLTANGTERRWGFDRPPRSPPPGHWNIMWEVVRNGG